MKRSDTYKYMASLFILAAVAVFLFFLRYDVPLCGDDIGGLLTVNPDDTYIDQRVIEGGGM